MRDLPSRDCATNLVYLRFVYWSILRLDGATHSQQVKIVRIIIIAKKWQI